MQISQLPEDARSFLRVRILTHPTQRLHSDIDAAAVAFGMENLYLLDPSQVGPPTKALPLQLQQNMRKSITTTSREVVTTRIKELAQLTLEEHKLFSGHLQKTMNITRQMIDDPRSIESHPDLQKVIRLCTQVYLFTSLAIKNQHVACAAKALGDRFDAILLLLKKENSLINAHLSSLNLPKEVTLAFEHYLKMQAALEHLEALLQAYPQRPIKDAPHLSERLSLLSSSVHSLYTMSQAPLQQNSLAETVNIIAHSTDHVTNKDCNDFLEDLQIASHSLAPECLPLFLSLPQPSQVSPAPLTSSGYLQRLTQGWFS